MFAIPSEVTATVYAEMPQSLRITGRRSGWAAGRHQQELDAFLEGPSFDCEGNLYVVDIPYGRVLKIAPGALLGLSLPSMTAGPTGLKSTKTVVSSLLTTSWVSFCLIRRPDASSH